MLRHNYEGGCGLDLFESTLLIFTTSRGCNVYMTAEVHSKVSVTNRTQFRVLEGCNIQRPRQPPRNQ